MVLLQRIFGHRNIATPPFPTAPARMMTRHLMRLQFRESSESATVWKVKGSGGGGNRVLPGGVGFDDGVAEGEQFAHTGGEGYLPGLAGGQQPLITASDGWVASGGRQGCHIQGGPQLASAAPHRALAAPLPAVPVAGSNARQGGDCLGAGVSQLGQMDDQCGDQDRPHAGDGAQQFGSGLPGGVVLQQCGDILVQLGHLPSQQRQVQQRQVVIDLGDHHFRRHLPPPVALLGLHGDQLTAPNWASAWASSRSVLASRPVARANSRTWQGLTTTAGSPAAPNSATSRVSNPPVASTIGGLHDDPLRLQRDQLRHQLAQTGVGVLHTPGPICRKRSTIQAGFGHVNADDGHCPSGHDVLHSRYPWFGVAGHSRTTRPCNTGSGQSAPHNCSG